MNDQPKTQQLQVIATGAHIAPLVPTSFEDIQRVARMVHASGMAPKAMKTAEAVGVAIMAGLELGLPPMQAVQSITVINGRPAVYGKLGLALVRNSPLCEYVTEHFEGEYPKDDFKAICKAKRKGHPEVVSEFSVADAKEASLWDERQIVKIWDYESKSYKDGPNPAPWFRFRKRMMQMRARNFALDDTFPDILRGFGIAEVMDEQPQSQRVIEAPPIPIEPVEEAQFIEVPGQQSLAGTSEPSSDATPTQPSGGGSPISDGPETQDESEILSDILIGLDETLSTATSVEQVHEFYTEFDAEARLTTIDAGDAVSTARTVRDRHLKRLSTEGSKEHKEATERSRQRVEAAGGAGIRQEMARDRADEQLAEDVRQEPIRASQTATEPSGHPDTGQATAAASEAPKGRKKPSKPKGALEPDAAEKPNPFALPEGGRYESAKHWREWWTTLCTAIRDSGGAVSAANLWRGQQEERDRLKVAISERGEIRDLLTKAIAPFQQKD